MSPFKARKAAPFAALVVAGVLSAHSRPALAWDTPEHMKLCKAVPFPTPVSSTVIKGFVPHEWCAVPDYAHNIQIMVTQGRCTTFTIDEWAGLIGVATCIDVLLQNNHHFGSYAYSNWHYYHQLAKSAAAKYAGSCTPGCDDVAFALEGWATHFLTDAFAAGHAWNPLGDYETPEGVYWMIHSAEEKLPDPLFPPPGGINVFRRGMHDHLNESTVKLNIPVKFADKFAKSNGVAVQAVGDHQYAANLAPAAQMAWTITRAKSAIWDVYWNLLGVNGMGGCQVSSICKPDYEKGYLDQGNAFDCVPFVSSGSMATAFDKLNANAETKTYYGDCSFLPPDGHDCSFNPERPIPFWSGSLHTYIDMPSVIDTMGCNMGDPVVYDNGTCLEDKWHKSWVVNNVCNAFPPGACDFTGTCDIPNPDQVGQDPGPGASTGTGPGTGGGAGSANGGAGGAMGGAGGATGGAATAGSAGQGGTGGSTGGGGQAGQPTGSAGSSGGGGSGGSGGPGCSCNLPNESGNPAWLGALALGGLLVKRRRTSRKHGAR